MTTMSLLRHFCVSHGGFETSFGIDSKQLCLRQSASFGATNLGFHPLKKRNSRRTDLLDAIAVLSSNNSDNGGNENGGGGDGGGSGDEEGNADGGGGNSWGIFGLLVNGWKSRVAADPQFAFKVLMEELVGVSACIVGDMATRPNFGLNELDLVFSTLVVGCILNFLLMYLLAPTISTTAVATLPAIFSTCPASHMFEPGAFTLLDRFGTFVYKGIVFAGVGFAAGLVGTAISNGLISMKKRIDPSFDTPNKPPPTLLNAMTWAAHMGISSNFRYQTLNGIEFLLEKWLSPFVFKSSVLVMRLLNNVLGGMTFVMLARVTGSQIVAVKEKVADENVKLVDETSGNGDSKTRFK